MNRISHITFLLSLGTWMIILLFCLIVTSCALNTDVNPELQNLPIETGGMYVSLGNMWPSHPSSGNAGKSSMQGLLDCMV